MEKLIELKVLTENIGMIKMKPLLLTILICLLPLTLYAGEYQYPKLSLQLKGNTIILRQRNNTFTYPPQKENEYPAITKLLQEDVNGDDKEEWILAAALKGIKCANDDGTVEDLLEFPYAVVLIAEQRGNEIDIQKQMVLGCNFPDFELADVNKDGIKDVIASGWEPMNWRHLKIVSWQNGKYVLLWNRGINDLIVEQSFGINGNGDAQIKVGYPRYIETEGRFDGYEPQKWEIWVWDGEKFALKEGNNK